MAPKSRRCCRVNHDRKYQQQRRRTDSLACLVQCKHTAGRRHSEIFSFAAGKVFFGPTNTHVQHENTGKAFPTPATKSSSAQLVLGRGGDDRRVGLNTDGRYAWGFSRHRTLPSSWENCAIPFFLSSSSRPIIDSKNAFLQALFTCPIIAFICNRVARVIFSTNILRKASIEQVMK